jgi:SAM-dependent methyltransferase
MEKVTKAKDFEKNLVHGKGIIPTPSSWIEYFWDVHKNKVVESLREHFQQASTVLFIGVGTGDVIPKLNPAGKRIIGIDLNATILEQAAQYCETILGDGSTLPLDNESCDLVVCNMVLHHIVEQGGLEQTLSEAARVLRPEGRFMAYEPNIYHPSGMALTLLNTFRLYHLVGGGSNYERALSPFSLVRACRPYFKTARARTLTLGHPRFPIALQNALFRLDRHCAALYPFSFSFTIEAFK